MSASQRLSLSPLAVIACTIFAAISFSGCETSPPLQVKTIHCNYFPEEAKKTFAFKPLARSQRAPEDYNKYRSAIAKKLEAAGWHWLKDGNQAAAYEVEFSYTEADPFEMRRGNARERRIP